MRRIAKLQNLTHPPHPSYSQKSKFRYPSKTPFYTNHQAKTRLIRKNQDSYTQAKRPFIQTNKPKLTVLGKSLSQNKDHISDVANNGWNPR